MPDKQKQSSSLFIPLLAAVLATGTVAGTATGFITHGLTKKSYQNQLQQKDTEIANIQNGYYPEPNIRFCELPEPLKNLYDAQTVIAHALFSKAHDAFDDLWKTLRPDKGPKYSGYKKARKHYCALALGAAGFPMWFDRIGDGYIISDKTESEKIVRQELKMEPNKPIDFSWIDEFYRKLQEKEQN